MIYKIESDKCLNEMTPKNRMIVFLLIFGIIVFALLGFFEIGLSYGARYFVFFVALAFYFVVVAVLEKRLEKSQFKTEK